MKKVVVSEFVSLDGVMENPQWTVQFNTPEQNEYKYEELKESDTLLLGRVTYEGFSAAWPNITNKAGGGIELPDGFSDRMNNYPKYVASTTLQEMKWNASLIKGDIAEEVTKLKQPPGRNILVLGSCDLVNTLLQHDLIDEYRLMVFPVVVGNGKRLFREGHDEKALKLVDTTTFKSGVTVLTYQRG